MGDPIRLLHVEDDPDFADLTIEFLSRTDQPFEVIHEVAPDDALDRLEADGVDCIVSDYELPRMNGVEFLRAVRETDPDVPFILFTGKGSEEVASDAISAGATDYIQKTAGTTQYEVLANRIENAVDQYRSQREVEASERRLSLFVEQSPLGVIEWNDAFEFVRVNESAEAILGYDEAELVGTSWERVVPPEDRDEIEDVVVEDLLADEGGFHSVNENLTKDGERILCEWHNHVVKDEGEVIAVFSQFQEITDRRERARELEQLKTVMEVANDAIIAIDEDSVIQSANPAVESVFGYSADEVVGEPLTTLMGPDAADRHLAGVERYLETGSRTVDWDRLEYTGRHRDGTEVPLAISLSEFEHDDDRFFVGVVRDVTDRQDRERTLERLVERTADLIESSSTEETAEVAVEIARTVLGAPLAGIHLLAEGDRLEAVTMMDEVHGDVELTATYRRDSDDPKHRLVWETFEDGEARYIDDVGAYGELAERTPARSVMVHPLDGRGVLIISATEPAAFDQTDRLYADLLANTVTAALEKVEREADFRSQTERLERLHETAESLHRAESRDEIAELVVEAAKDLFDSPYAAVRYYDESVAGLVPAATSAATEAELGELRTFDADSGSLNWAAFESGSSALYEDISTVDRAVHARSAVSSLMVFPMGEHGTFSVGDDTPRSFDETDRFHGELLAGTAELALTQLDRETTLVEQRDLLDRQNERLEQFASVVSHDLRNPLNVASGRLELARAECDSEHLDGVAAAHERMSGLIDDLLTLAREGDRIGAVETVDLGAFVEACWRNVETGDATLVVEVDRSVEADRSRLAQLLENLFRNAVEHGGDGVTVTVGELDDGFYVEDDGVGIPADRRDELFDPGYTTTDTGTGFGLPIVREIVRAHGWSIALAERPRGGARFEITGLDDGG